MRVFGALVGAALLSGCTAAPVVPLPDDPQKAIPVSASPEPEVTYAPSTLPTTSASPKPQITADPELVASLECEPVSAELLEAMLFGEPTRSAQVEVGEGNTPGQTWWVVVLDMPAYEQTPAGQAFFLTTGPGVRQTGETGSWIQLGRDMGLVGIQGASLDHREVWQYVDWDVERLIRGQSALVKAIQCLEDTA